MVICDPDIALSLGFDRIGLGDLALGTLGVHTMSSVTETPDGGVIIKFGDDIIQLIVKAMNGFGCYPASNKIWYVYSNTQWEKIVEASSPGDSIVPPVFEMVGESKLCYARCDELNAREVLVILADILRDAR
jgi:hypothetical protein